MRIFCCLLLLVVSCSKDENPPTNDVSTKTSDADTRDAERDVTSVGDMRRDATVPDQSRIDFPNRDLGFGDSGSVVFSLNAAREAEYGLLTDIPAEFGVGEFTLDFWIKPDDAFPFGQTAGSSLENWSEEDPEPYNNGAWWYPGNFLIDGHNNSSFDLGTFSVQFFGRGRVRWHLADGDVPSGGSWVAQPFPATTGPNIVDGAWHKVALVRRWRDIDLADMELWIDGVLIATETMNGRVNMQNYWDGWPDFSAQERGWFFGSEKQAAYGQLDVYEDYKGHFSQLRFWSRARSMDELSTAWQNETEGTEAGLVGYFPMSEGAGDEACDVLAPARCISFFRTDASFWSQEGPPVL